MDLTPIKVRGKRRAVGDQVAFAAPPKRPPKKARNHENAAKHRLSKASKKISKMESTLPLEILESILWLSEEVNFPRASPRLGRILSGRSTLMRTFLLAFGPTWEVWSGCIRLRYYGFNFRDPRGHEVFAVRSYPGWDTDGDRFGGEPGFQSDLLACSWTTIDMILDCWHMWVQLHARNRPFMDIPLWTDPYEPHSNLVNEALFGDSVTQEMTRYFYRDYDAFQALLTQAPMRLILSSSTWIALHCDTKIPDHLLTGPWDENALRKLFWVMQAGARLPADPNKSWELTLEGFRNACADEEAPNMVALRVLGSLESFIKWPEHTRQEEFDRIRTSTIMSQDHIAWIEDVLFTNRTLS
ncbi:hypothetical protein F4808DRAFT_39673 [Astrocystis sublimbata]|nr:hypothetical protein F4808DRAFT_39673 [Astrocystis sublimbata]